MKTLEFFDKAKEVVKKVCLAIITAVGVLFGIKIIKDKVEEDKELKDDIKDKKEDIKKDKKDIESENIDNGKKEIELKDKIKEVEDKIKDSKQDKENLNNILPDLKKE